MRPIVCVALVALLWTGAIPFAAAQEPKDNSQLASQGDDIASPETPGGLTPEDVKQLQESAQGLRQVFGIEPPPVTPAPTTPAMQEMPSKPTMAEVADKAVDIVNRMVVSAVESIQRVAPDVWRIMIKQQYAKAAGDLMVPAGMLITVIVLNLTYLRKIRGFATECKARVTEKKTARDAETSDMERKRLTQEINQEESEGNFMGVIGYVVPALGFFFSIIWTLNRLSESAKYLINPEFYAIRDLLTMLLNRGQPMP